MSGGMEAGVSRRFELPAAGLAMRIACLAGLVAAALAMRLHYATAADVSWLLSVGERFIAGERLYVDLIEVNPPASVYLYLPPLWLAGASGLRPEFWVGFLVFLAIFLSLAISASVLRLARGCAPLVCAPVALGVFFVLAILPGETFAQREHIATICSLPWLAVAALRYEGGKPRTYHILFAGLCGGMLFAIKPLFAAPMMMVFSGLLISKRSPGVLLLAENWTAATVACAYTASTFWLHPEFWTEAMPLLNALYIPMRNFSALMQADHLLFWFAASVAALAGGARTPLRTSVLVLFLASSGFAIACIWQAKFWPYHFYPMMALAAISCWIVAVHTWQTSDNRMLHRWGFVCGLAACLLAARLWALFGVQEDYRPLADALARAAPNPSVVVISPDLSLGHPATRLAGGRWAQSLCSLWIAGHARVLRQRAAAQGDVAWTLRIDAAEALQLATLRKDLEQRPDALVVPVESLQWIAAHPRIAAHVASYETIKTVKMPLSGRDVLVMRRQS